MSRMSTFIRATAAVATRGGASARADVGVGEVDP